jgi:NADH pyrophosphatase NudC (nudix superfamily)
MEDEDPRRKKEPSFWENVASWAKILESLFYVANAATQIYHIYSEEKRSKTIAPPSAPPPTPPPSAPPAAEVEFESMNLSGEDVQARDGTPTCVFCMDNTIQTIIRPCNHAVLCFACARHYQEVVQQHRFCPLCKEPMESIEKIYFG